MAITRITARWSGFRGAPGYSNFYFDGEFAGAPAVEAAAVAVSDFFSGFYAFLPGPVSIAVQPTAEVVDETTGQTLSILDFSAPAAVVGGTADNYSAAVGAVVNWNTNDYVNGRRVRGRTFVVPLTSTAFDEEGDISSGALDSLRSAASGLVTATMDLPLAVWHRPANGSGGSSHVVTSATVPDLGAVLRSRRD